jgi:2-polyprenyl-3-methyl-5-hydroxy-6-metoxy-1,4-benzoquinol methylase
VNLWRREDTEAVPCCVCQREGRPIYDLDPFGVVRCPRCTLVFVSPRLRPEALDRLYGDPGYHAGMYDNSRVAMLLQRRWTSGRLTLVQEQLGRPAAGARLLEVGAGRGMFLAAARQAGFEVTGVELSGDAAAHAERTYDLTVHRTQLADAPLTGRFDVICAWDTIEHVPDPVEFWRTVHHLLAPDGVAVFSTPYFSSLPSRLLRARWWTLKPTEHIWQFTPRTHRTVAAQAEMTVTDTMRNPLSRANFGRLDSLIGVARAAAS